MLTLTRRHGERLILDTGEHTITIRYHEGQSRQARISIDAPKEVAIWREELVAPNYQGRRVHQPRRR